MTATRRQATIQLQVWAGIFLASFLAYKVLELWPLGLPNLEQASLAKLLTEGAIVLALIVFAYALSQALPNRIDRTNGPERASSRSRSTPMRPDRHVLIVGKETVLGAAIQNLLGKTANLRVTGVRADQGSELLREMQRKPPDVIVVGAKFELNTLHLLRALPTHSRTRLIAIRSDSAEARIYELKHVLISEGDDLVRMIASG